MQLFRKSDLEVALELAGLFEKQYRGEMTPNDCIYVKRFDPYYRWEWYAFPVRIERVGRSIRFERMRNKAIVDQHGIRITKSDRGGTISFGHVGEGLKWIFSRGIIDRKFL